MQRSFDQYQSCIEACLRCATTCNNNASLCTREAEVHKLAACIQLSMECAAICYGAARLMSLGSKKAKDLCHLCAQLCEACGDECSKFQSKHCQDCADACMLCAEECKKLELEPELV